MKDNSKALSSSLLGKKIVTNTKLIKGLNWHTLFERILEEIKKDLFIKNYTEKMIGSTTENGYFLQELRAAFGQAVYDHLWEPQVAKFDLSMTGYFAVRDDKAGASPKSSVSKDKVCFEFSFAYDPLYPRPTLKITGLKATLNDEWEMVYPVVHNASRELLAAGKVHVELDRQRTQQLVQAAYQANLPKKSKRRKE